MIDILYTSCMNMYIKVQCNYTTYSELHCTLIYHIHDKHAIGTCMAHYIRVCPHDHVGAQAIYICVCTCVCVCVRVRMYVFCLQLFPVCILGHFLWSHLYIEIQYRRIILDGRAGHWCMRVHG